MTEEKKDAEYLAQIVEPLLDWYSEHRRILPWREEPTPYRVWISEIMLQQTRVEAGKAYFERFVAELPDVAALANADDQLLMKLWEGLGYYNRARNLKKAAGVVVEQYSGQVPASYEKLLELPGVGPYTAGAVASIAFGIPAPAVDGNVLRVVSRILEKRDDIAKPAVKKSMEEMIRTIMPEERPGDFNQALMELGAIVCLPNGAPKCGDCPAAELCRARISGVTAEIPVKKMKKRRVEEKTMLILLDDGGRMGLRRRPEKGLLSGLWELPSFEGGLSGSQVRERLEGSGFTCGEICGVQEAKHIFSHVEWRMTGYVVRVLGAVGSGLPAAAAPSGKLAYRNGAVGSRGSESGNMLAAEERTVYLKDVEEGKSKGARQLSVEAETGMLRPESLVYASGAELAEIYALPSAFKGFRDYFPR